MNPYGWDSEFKKLHNDAKEKLLAFQDQERFPGMWTAGTGEEQSTETWLFPVLWGLGTESNRNPSYIGNSTANFITSLR